MDFEPNLGVFGASDISLDVASVVVAVIVFVYALRIRSTFRGGAIWRPWAYIATSTIIFAAAEASHIVADVTDQVLIDILGTALNLLFVLVLAYGLFLMHEFWTRPKGG